jgi:hypothetical protein
MVDEWERKQIEEEYERLGGGLFGDPQVKPRSYHCPDHDRIASRDIVWKGTIPHCPKCDKVLEVKSGTQAG